MQPDRLRIDDRSVRNALLRQSLAAFIVRSYATVDASQPYIHNWHIEVIADHLERAFRREIKRLIITLPPRSLKSISASVAFPAWALGRDPTLQIICASYSNDLSVKLARDCRTVMRSGWYREAFATRIDQKKQAAEDFGTTNAGYRLATSVGGTLTGRGAGIVIIDDPLKAQEALSKPARDSLKQWYDGTLYTRLNDKQRDVIILIQQRVHLDDLVGHVLDRGDWVHLNLPAIATSRETFTLKNGRRYGRNSGELLHPSRENEGVLDDARKTLGPFHFGAQYQQSPVAEGGNLIRWDWFRTYKSYPRIPDAENVTQSWDVATTDSDGSDWSVCTTWAESDGCFYLIDIVRARLQFPDLKRRIIAEKQKNYAANVLIEESGLGLGLIQQLRDEGTFVISRKAERSKADRMAAQSSAIEAGRVFLPEQALWLETLRAEVVAFPQSRHDDQVDSISQFLNWATTRVRHQFW